MRGWGTGWGGGGSRGATDPDQGKDEFRGVCGGHKVRDQMRTGRRGAGVKFASCGIIHIQHDSWPGTLGPVSPLWLSRLPQHLCLGSILRVAETWCWNVCEVRWPHLLYTFNHSTTNTRSSQNWAG